MVVAVLKWRGAFEASFLPGQKMSLVFTLRFFENGYELKLFLGPVVGAHKQFYVAYSLAYSCTFFRAEKLCFLLLSS